MTQASMLMGVGTILWSSSLGGSRVLESGHSSASVQIKLGTGGGTRTVDFSKDRIQLQDVPAIEFTAAAVAPKISHLFTFANDDPADTFTIQAQHQQSTGGTGLGTGADLDLLAGNVTGAGNPANAGDVNISSGSAAGAGTDGEVHLQVGGSDALVLDSTEATFQGRFTVGASVVAIGVVTLRFEDQVVAPVITQENRATAADAERLLIRGQQQNINAAGPWDGGDLTVSSGGVTQAANIGLSGNTLLTTGNTAGSGDSGSTTVDTGTSASGNPGSVLVKRGGVTQATFDGTTIDLAVTTRLPNNVALQGEIAATGTWRDLIQVNSTDQVRVGDGSATTQINGSSVSILTSGSARAIFGSAELDLRVAGINWNKDVVAPQITQDVETVDSTDGGALRVRRLVMAAI
jgi:hypothetical protein